MLRLIYASLNCSILICHFLVLYGPSYIISDFLFDASETHWDKLFVTAIKSSDSNKLREQIYLWLIKNCSEDEVNNIQGYFVDRCPAYIRNTPVTNISYRVLTCVGCEIGKVPIYLTCILYVLKNYMS